MTLVSHERGVHLHLRFDIYCQCSSPSSRAGIQVWRGRRFLGGKWSREWCCRCRQWWGSKISIANQGGRQQVHRRAGQAMGLSQGLVDTTRIHRYSENAKVSIKFRRKADYHIRSLARMEHIANCSTSISNPNTCITTHVNRAPSRTHLAPF